MKMSKENEIDSFAEAFEKISDLSLKEQNALFETLRRHLLDYEPVQEIPVKYQIFVSSIWFVILSTGGLLEIKPLWFSVCLYPILGLPVALFYVWTRKDAKYTIDFPQLCLHLFLIGPCFSVIGGLILGALLYFPLKWVGIIS
jgi:hypothetical protein